MPNTQTLQTEFKSEHTSATITTQHWSWSVPVFGRFSTFDRITDWTLTLSPHLIQSWGGNDKPIRRPLSGVCATRLSSLIWPLPLGSRGTFLPLPLVSPSHYGFYNIFYILYGNRIVIGADQKSLAGNTKRITL